MADYCKMWESLGINLEAHDQLLNAIPPIYQQIFLDQINRPQAMSYFDMVVMEIHGLRIQELQEHKAKGGAVVGSFCVYVPEEIVLAAGGLNVGLCAGAEIGFDEAEKILPRNLCPLIKSAFGFKMSRVCPYFESCDLIVGENTCDGKKKAWEIMTEDVVPVYTMDIPQVKSEKGKELWLDEVKKFKEKMEEVSGKKIEVDELAKAIKLVNDKRRALQRLSNLRKNKPSPISGRDALLIEEIAFYDDNPRFIEKVNVLCDELEERIEKGEGSKKDAPRVMISGCPMVIPNWKLPFIIESSGASLVCEESCTGQRYFEDLVAEDGGSVGAQLEAIADRYLKIDCSCFTPNQERIDNIVKLAKEFEVDGVIYNVLQFCDPYAVEYRRVEKALEKEGISVLRIETDYGQEDSGQIKTRVEAFVEMIS
ncbi:MAG TPA: 2-hydroxyacyl-CoA dehydratase [Actinobacteria bacterium]|nr:2-hydroxyacyl-CoA dehydratase [Actinomycetota bacterium]